jgi:hypothetical protein
MSKLETTKRYILILKKIRMSSKYDIVVKLFSLEELEND